MSASVSRRISLAVLAVLLTGAGALARAEGPPVAGGTVPSTLELSLGEPSDFVRTGAARGGSVFTSVVPVEVTSTDAPVRLSIGDGETLESWSEPVTRARAKVRLRRVAPDARKLRRNHKLLLVTLTAGGP